MAFPDAWVETDPDGAVVFVSQLDDHIHLTKRALRQRLEGDPAVPDLTGLIEVGSWASAPKPRKGTARVYVDTDVNILAFGVTKREDGRLAFATDTKKLYHVGTAAVIEIGYVPVAGGVTIVHTGVANPVLGIRAPNGTPWALAIQNDVYSTNPLFGLRLRVTVGGDGTIRAPDDGSNPGNLDFQTDETGRWRVSSGGDLISLGASNNLVVNTTTLATSATDGFLHVPIMNSAPTGVPTDFGGKALVWDVVNERLYIRGISAWKFVQFN